MSRKAGEQLGSNSTGATQNRALDGIMSSIQTVHRDTNARRVLLFSVLDTLERLTGRKIETLCSPSFARTRLTALIAELTPEACALLLPAAERAVAALQTVQDGFYLRQQLGAKTIDVPAVGGGVRSLNLDWATAECTSRCCALRPTATAPTGRAGSS